MRDRLRIFKLTRAQAARVLIRELVERRRRGAVDGRSMFLRVHSAYVHSREPVVLPNYYRSYELDLSTPLISSLYSCNLQLLIRELP